MVPDSFFSGRPHQEQPAIRTHTSGRPRVVAELSRAWGFGPVLFPGLLIFQFSDRGSALTIDAPAKCADERDAEAARAS